MEALRGVEVWLRLFLTQTVDGPEWLAALPGHFTSGKEHQYALARGVGGLQSRLGVSEKRRSPSPLLVLIRILSEHLVDKQRRLTVTLIRTNTSVHEYRHSKPPYRF